MFIILYRLLYLPSFLISLPLLIHHLFINLRYRCNVINWFGLYPDLPMTKQERIWIHAASVGESQSIWKLLQLLRSGDLFIIITVQNIHAYLMLQKQYADDDNVYIGFFPVDFYPFSYLAWQKIRPKLALLVDSELWPEHLTQAKNHNVPLWLINQRHSKKTYDRFHKFPSFFHYIYSHVELVWSSSKRDYQYMQKLGLPALKCRYRGNLKCDTYVHDQLSQQQKIDLKEQIGFGGSEPCVILLAASSWPGEEQLMLSVLERCIALCIPVKLILAPRHPTRLNEILPHVQKTKLAYQVRSQKSDIQQDNIIYIADTIGELRSFYQISDVAFIGKSSEKNTGGQNPIEAAAFACAMVYGPNMQNFSDISNDLVNHNASVQAASDTDITEQLLFLLTHADSRRQQVISAKLWLDANKDCAHHIYRAIESKLFNSKKNTPDDFSSLDIYPGL